MVKFQISLIFENADIFFFKYDEKFWLEWIIIFEERFVVLVIFTEVASFKFTFILINSVWKAFCYPTVLFGLTPYSVIRAYSVGHICKCATLLRYTAKRKDHHGVSSGWSSVWHCSNTGLSSSQYEQISIILGVWPFCLTAFFFRSITFWRAYG